MWLKITAVYFKSCMIAMHKQQPWFGANLDLASFVEIFTHDTLTLLDLWCAKVTLKNRFNRLLQSQMDFKLAKRALREVAICHPALMPTVDLDLVGKYGGPNKSRWLGFRETV